LLIKIPNHLFHGAAPPVNFFDHQNAGVVVTGCYLYFLSDDEKAKIKSCTAYRSPQQFLRTVSARSNLSQHHTIKDQSDSSHQSNNTQEDGFPPPIGGNLSECESDQTDTQHGDNQENKINNLELWNPDPCSPSSALFCTFMTGNRRGITFSNFRRRNM